MPRRLWRVVDLRVMLDGVWNWSRTTMADAAGVSSFMTLVFAGLSVWQFAAGHPSAGGGLALLAFSFLVYGGLGWYFRRDRPDDPWEPW